MRRSSSATCVCRQLMVRRCLTGNAIPSPQLALPRFTATRRAAGRKTVKGLKPAFKALRDGDTLVVCRLDRLCRNSRHVVDLVNTLTERGVHLRVIASLGAAAETSRSRIIGRARGRKGGRKPKMTAAKVNLAMAALASPKTRVAELCDGLGITRQTLYRHVSPAGGLRPAGARVLNSDVDW